MSAGKTHFLKFRSISGEFRERTFDIIRTKSFYIPSFSELNDPFDCNLPFDVDDEKHCLFLMKEFSETDIDDSFALWLLSKGDQDYKTRILTWLNDTEVRRQLYHKLFNAYGVVSFSKKEGVLSHPLMWAHYADSHKGICLEFESYDLLILKEVHYGDQLPKVNVLKVDNENVGDIFWHKGSMWSYEQEIRYVTTSPEAKKLPFPSESLKAIYFGANTDWKDIEAVQDLVKQENMNVEFGRMTASTVSNKLEVIQMPQVSSMKQLARQHGAPIHNEIKTALKEIVKGTVYEYRDELRRRTLPED